MTIDLSEEGKFAEPVRHRFLTRTAIVIFCLCAVLSLVTLWARARILDTDSYVRTVAPLATDPAIQQAIAAQITDRLTVHIIGDQPVRAGLFGSNRATSGPLTAGTLAFVDRTVQTFVASPEFATLWEQANREIHPTVKALLTGKETGAVQVQAGEIVLDLTPVYQQIERKLEAVGLGAVSRIQFAPTDTRYVLFQSAALQRAAGWVSVLLTLSIAFPVIALGSLATYLFLSHDRGAAGVRAAFALAIGMALLLVLIAIARWLYLGNLASGRDRAASAAVFDLTLHTLRVSARWLVLAGLVVSGLTWLFQRQTGRLRVPAVALRRYWRAARVVLIVAYCLAVIAIDPLTPAVALVGLGVVIAGVLAINSLARKTSVPVAEHEPGAG